MEPHINRDENIISQLQQVTPLSKYLAMVLFITLPFLGGYVGYQFALEGVVEVDYIEAVNPIDVVDVAADPLGRETKPTLDISSEARNNEYTETQYGQFVLVPPDRYMIPAGYFPDYDTQLDELYPIMARKLSDDLSLVQVASRQHPAGPIGAVLFDESSNAIVRPVDFTLNTMDIWINPRTRIVLEWDLAYKNRLVIYDYIANTSETLYEETVTGVQLAEVCELGCAGLLYVTSDGKLVFGRHQKIDGTSDTRLLEVVTLPIPEEYLSK